MSKSVSSEEKKGLPGLSQAALFGLCLQCHAKTLFDAPASIAYRCRACGLEFAKLERGSRAGSLVTFAIAALLIGSAFAIDSWLRAPLWVMAVIFVPLTFATTLAGLRFFKTLLLTASYERSLEQKGE